jgi:hypothetical protein
MTCAAKIRNMESMNLEQTYCRGPLAKMFNRMPQTVWIPNRNDPAATYERGRPDAFVCREGRYLAVECKAGVGSVFLGDPADENRTDGWHFHQRRWWQLVAQPSGMAYWIALWLYPARQLPSRVFHKDARLFLVPPEVWLDTEAKLNGRKTLALNADLEREHAYKGITAESQFASYALVFEQGHWHIPDPHLFWQ